MWLLRLLMRYPLERIRSKCRRRKIRIIPLQHLHPACGFQMLATFLQCRTCILSWRRSLRRLTFLTSSETSCFILGIICLGHMIDCERMNACNSLQYQIPFLSLLHQWGCTTNRPSLASREGSLAN
jgi:hypothetical protein